MLPKFSSERDGEWLSHEYPHVYAPEQTSSRRRLRIAASGSGVDLLSALIAVTAPPYACLYVLLVGRGGSAEGRYQSPWWSKEELSSFVSEAKPFLEQDGRHHFWLFSHPDEVTLVFDQHNVIFAYGPLERFIAVLRELGYSEVQRLDFPAPHQHHYHFQFDDKERAITGNLEWHRSELKKGDEW